MQVRDVMTENPACCAPETNLQEVARLMVQQNCGMIPVVENRQSMKLVGVITDRDITCRTIAEGKNPLPMSASAVMSSPVVTATPEMDMGDCCGAMEQYQVRRIPVIDDQGRCCGVVAQADVARQAGPKQAGELVEEVSGPAAKPSGVSG